MLAFLDEIRSFFDNVLQMDDVIALLDVIPNSLKILIFGGIAFSSAIAVKRIVF